MHKVVVVGSVTMDVTAFASPLPKPGETVLGTRFETIPGGKGANQAIAAARAGGSVAMIGCIGTDAFGDEVLANLEREGIDVAGVSRVDDRTGIAHIRVDSAGQNDIVVVPLANAHLTADYVTEQLPRVAAEGDVLLVQLEIPYPTVQAAIRVGQELGLRVVLDPAPAPAPGSLEADIWEGLFAVTPNESEAAAVAQTDTSDLAGVRGASDHFRDLGVANVILTLGERGSWVHGDGDGELLPASRVEVVDTTAAGDAFAGYLGAAIAGGASLSEAVRLAMAAGTLAVTRIGASASIPRTAEISEFLDKG